MNQEREVIHQQYKTLYNEAVGRAEQQFDGQKKAVSDMQVLLQQREADFNRLQSELQVIVIIHQWGAYVYTSTRHKTRNMQHSN